MSDDNTDQHQDQQQEHRGYAEKQRQKFVDEERDLTDMPDITDEHWDTARSMRQSYEEDRPTTVMPGTDNTVTGTAVNDWVDDDGNPKYGGDSKDTGSGNTDSGDTGAGEARPHDDSEPVHTQTRG